MRIIKLQDNTKYIVADTTQLISPAGYHPDTRVIGIKKDVTLKEYSCDTVEEATKLARIDFKNSRYNVMLWDVEKHYAKYSREVS